MHLAKRLNEELAQQNQSSRSYGSGRAISPDPEPRSKSYDNKSAQTKGKGTIKFILRCFLKSYWNNYFIILKNSQKKASKSSFILYTKKNVDIIN